MRRPSDEFFDSLGTLLDQDFDGVLFAEAIARS
jgi:hypothetical protein